MENSSTTDDSLTSLHDSDSSKYMYLLSIYRILSRYTYIIPVVVGVPGNILSILVANRKQNRALSPCIYIKAMAVADTSALIGQVVGIPVLYTAELGADISHMRAALHKVHFYMMYVSAMLSSLFLAEMSIDRLLAVRFPMVVPRLCTATRASKTVVITTVLVLIFNLQVPFVHVYAKDQVTGTEILFVHVPNYVEVELLATWSQLILGTVIPFVIILSCNVLIIITIKRASTERAKLKAGSGQEPKERKNDTHLLRMLIFVSCAYVVTSIPYRLYSVLMELPAIANIYNMEDTYWSRRYLVEVCFLYNVWLLNYAINFYLYCIGGGRKYRNDTDDVIKSFAASCRKAKATI